MLNKAPPRPASIARGSSPPAPSGGPPGPDSLLGGFFGLLAYVQVLAGFVLLLIGGEVLVRGAVTLASRLGLSALFIGLTVVACGTSAPEMVVSLLAALNDAPAITVGNVVGSNIANILLILGASALVYPISCHQRGIRRDGTVVILASVGMLLLSLGGVLELWQGAVMLLGLVIYLVYAYQTDRRDQRAAQEIVREVEEMRRPGEPLWLMLARLFGGIGGVVFGADVLIDGGVVIARSHGISEAAIGLTMFALGTSLPELATSVAAARQKHSDIALGNVVGSNIFNILWVMGLVATVTPVRVPYQIISFDLWVMLGVTAGFLAVAAVARRIGRVTGAVFVLLYIAYVAAQFIGLSGLPTPVPGPG